MRNECIKRDSTLHLEQLFVWCSLPPVPCKVTKVAFGIRPFCTHTLSKQAQQERLIDHVNQRSNFSLTLTDSIGVDNVKLKL